MVRRIEFCFGVLKILLVICLIIVGLVIDLGGALIMTVLDSGTGKTPVYFQNDTLRAL